MTFWGSTTVIEKVYVTSAKATDKSAISSFVNGQRYMLLSPAVVEAKAVEPRDEYHTIELRSGLEFNLMRSFTPYVWRVLLVKAGAVCIASSSTFTLVIFDCEDTASAFGMFSVNVVVTTMSFASPLGSWPL